MSALAVSGGHLGDAEPGGEQHPQPGLSLQRYLRTRVGCHRYRRSGLFSGPRPINESGQLCHHRWTS